ncbi:MAG: hypothetical protein VKS61_11280 [Candidatus Sericytochromatia bacterium]|nr:hypothetical protein [Candidatus Sericytochromatia bacterium]
MAPPRLSLLSLGLVACCLAGGVVPGAVRAGWLPAAWAAPAATAGPTVSVTDEDRLLEAFDRVLVTAYKLERILEAGDWLAAEATAGVLAQRVAEAEAYAAPGQRALEPVSLRIALVRSLIDARHPGSLREARNLLEDINTAQSEVLQPAPPVAGARPSPTSDARRRPPRRGPRSAPRRSAARAPSSRPTPAVEPTTEPTPPPSPAPTAAPTAAPTPTARPTAPATEMPTAKPSGGGSRRAQRGRPRPAPTLLPPSVPPLPTNTGLIRFSALLSPRPTPTPTPRPTPTAEGPARPPALSDPARRQLARERFTRAYISASTVYTYMRIGQTPEAQREVGLLRVHLGVAMQVGTAGQRRAIAELERLAARLEEQLRQGDGEAFATSRALTERFLEVEARI